MAFTCWTKDTVAMVTGGNKGIGYKIVKGLAKAGLTVVLTARDEGRGEAAQKSLHAEGFEAVHLHPLAVDSDDSVKKLAGWLEGKFNGIDILVNNAGIGIQAVSYENAYETMNTNFWGVQRVTQESAQRDTPRNDLAHVDTEEGLESLVQKFFQDAKAGALDDWSARNQQFAASKLLLNARIRIAHKSLADKGIALNCVCPGLVRTDMTEWLNEPKLTTAEGADTPVWLALLPTNNYPIGKFFAERKEISY